MKKNVFFALRIPPFAGRLNSPVMCDGKEDWIGLVPILGLEPVSLIIKKSRLRWFGHVERKDDNDWVKRCITWEVEGIRQRGRLKKTWWDCVKNDVESLGLSQKDAESRNKWRRRINEATG